MPEKSLENIIALYAISLYEAEKLAYVNTDLKWAEREKALKGTIQSIKDYYLAKLPKERKIELRSIAEFELRKQDEIYNQAINEMRKAIEE